jgi:alpha-glucoside transport system permease protein
VRQPDGARRWALLAPALIVVAGWWIGPALATVWLAVVDGGSFAAVDHLRFVASSGAAREAIRNTLVWVVAVGVGATVAGVGLAALAERLRAHRILVPVVVLPTVIAPVVVGVMWRSLLAFRPSGTDQVGLVNALVATPGLDPVAWLTQAPLNTLLLAGALVWVQTGVAMLVVSTAMGRVPDDVREAAQLDGASDAQVFGRITLPSIRGAVVLAGLSSVVVAIRTFDMVKVATDGQYGTSVLATEMFDQAFLLDQSGRGATLALVMAALAAPVAVMAVRRHRRGLVVA